MGQTLVSEVLSRHRGLEGTCLENQVTLNVGWARVICGCHHYAVSHTIPPQALLKKTSSSTDQGMICRKTSRQSEPTSEKRAPLFSENPSGIISRLYNMVKAIYNGVAIMLGRTRFLEHVLSQLAPPR